ncbi:MAG: hypothetical protein ACI4IX_01955 [Acutalibacteraceae bacterium]
MSSSVLRKMKEDDCLDYSNINVIETAIEAIREEVKVLYAKMRFANIKTSKSA